jgi:hypothetical protein
LGFCAFFKIWIEFFENLLTGAFDVDLEGFEDAGGDAVSFPKKTEENVLRADVGVMEGLGFFAGQSENLLHAGGIGDIAGDLGVGSGADLLFDFHPNRFQIEPHFLKNIDGDALSKLDQAKENVFRSHVVVVEAVGLLASESEDLLGAWGEIIHLR